MKIDIDLLDRRLNLMPGPFGTLCDPETFFIIFKKVKKEKTQLIFTYSALEKQHFFVMYKSSLDVLRFIYQLYSRRQCFLQVNTMPGSKKIPCSELKSIYSN
ncbi:MAG: hypothetical protein MI866_03805 [Bacteroidales bacterium]|nr:hypothetical protein [Bacteroidales bacterium]